MTIQYNNPRGGVPSDIGPQSVTSYHIKKALVTARRKQVFTQLASVKHMPKNMGKAMTVHEYLPLLDDRNINDQGLNATGAVIANGNLYGSSKDIGTITSKLPLLGENGGRVNRVGFRRIEWTGSLIKLGFFTEITQDALDFDSDPELWSNITTEMVNGAVEVSEDLLQRDLLMGAGTILYAGAATSNATVTGEGATPSVVTYAALQRLSTMLDDARTPKQTKVISGSRYVDTRTVGSGRILYIGSELLPLLENMKDVHNNPAFIPVHKYASSGDVVEGEVGAVASFRVVVAEEMLHWAGEGATETAANLGYRVTNVGGTDKYNVYPMLVVGDDAFSTIGFQTDGKTVKFRIITELPGEKTADRNDPYGETGFCSIRWHYGTIIYRPSRLGLLKTVAPV